MIINKKLAAVAAVAVGAGLASAQPAMKPKLPDPAPAVDMAVLAEKVVGVSARVKEGDVVQIYFGPGDLALVEEIAVAVRKRGAHPLLQFNSESLAKKLVAAVPEKYDSQPPKLALELNKFVNVRIIVPPVRDPAIYASLSAQRQMKQAKAQQPAFEGARKKNLRSVDLGNGFAPSPSRAKELGISEPELAKLYWDGLTTDYSAVEARCNALKTTLAGGKELKITHPNGTDLTVKIAGKKLTTSDGVISDADVKAGGPGVQVWLPAGEVYLIPGVSNGKVVDDRLIDEGKVIERLSVDVKAGKATAFTAKSGWDPIKARYDLAGPGKNQLSLIDFGCNPAMKSAGKLETFISAGMVTVGFGGNVWAGGTNREAFTLLLHLPGANVSLDGKPLIENGQLK